MTRMTRLTLDLRFSKTIDPRGECVEFLLASKVHKIHDPLEIFVVGKMALQLKDAADESTDDVSHKQNEQNTKIWLPLRMPITCSDEIIC